MEEGDLRALETIFAQVEDPRIERIKAGWDTTSLQRVLAGVNEMLLPWGCTAKGLTDSSMYAHTTSSIICRLIC